MVGDYKGEDQGKLNVMISPCDEKGNSLGEDYFIEESSELLGKPYNYKVNQ